MTSVKKLLPHLALRKAVYERLKSDLGGKFTVYEREPSKVSRYVAITEIEVEDLKFKTAAVFSADVEIVAHLEGPRAHKGVEFMLAEVVESLTRADLTLPEFNTFELDLEFAASGRESTGVYRGVARFSTQIDHS